jgi:hypothetical protein
VKLALFLPLACAFGSALAAQAAPSDAPSSAPSDPFVQATHGSQACSAPKLKALSDAETRSQEHVRVQHGGSCYLSGRCRLPNSYLYDAEIIPRVALYLQQDGRFGDTSIWLLGQRRLVTLLGCVQSAEQAAQVERAVLLIDDVMGVINLLSVPAASSPAQPASADVQ